MAKKKNVVFRLLGFALGISGGFFLANIAGSALTCRKNVEKMKQHENENNLMHSLLFGMETVTINSDTNNAYLNCQCGSMTIEMKELPINKDVYINISSVCSKIHVKLPMGIKVIHEGKGLFGKIDSVAYPCEEDAPTVHIIRNNTIATKVIVKFANSEDEEDTIDIDDIDEFDDEVI